MNITRNGKIARLPKAVRDELNRRLSDGEPGKELVAWLNSLPEVRSVVAVEFDGRPVREQNLSEWKQGGYGEWLRQQEALELVRSLSEEAQEMKAAADEPLTEKLGLWLVARYAVATRKLAGKDNDGEIDWPRLRELCQDVVALRRGDHSAVRLKIEQERLEREREKTEEEVVEHFKRWAQNPAIKDCLCDKHISREERARRLREIYGLPPKPATDAGTQADTEPHGDAVESAPDQAQSG
jgi:hypothetical protein